MLFRSSEQVTNFTRVGITGNGDGSYEYRLTGLSKYTKYSVVVKAFNGKGDGPASEPVVAQTHEDGEPLFSNPVSFYFSCGGVV